jgi:hypothetical protein
VTPGQKWSRFFERTVRQVLNLKSFLSELSGVTVLVIKAVVYLKNRTSMCMYGPSSSHQFIFSWPSFLCQFIFRAGRQRALELW